MDTNLLKGSKNIFNIFSVFNYRRKFALSHPDFFDPSGLLVFCAEQGSGKTLSAVQYCVKVNDIYSNCVFCTNVSIKGLEFNCYYVFKQISNCVSEVCYYKLDDNSLVKKVVTSTFGGVTKSVIEVIQNIKIVVEYDGLDCIKNLSNGEQGVLYFIDEIHLEFNSLESKNIPIEIMVEVSQQRKQRKHIVGTSQIFMRLAKPLREQIDTVVLCKNYLSCIQFNTVINGKTAVEENGKLNAEILYKSLWFHTPKLYTSYDTYAKMKRYRNEWKGVSRSNIYDTQQNNVINLEVKK